jgi:hypothetical protein
LDGEDDVVDSVVGTDSEASVVVLAAVELVMVVGEVEVVGRVVVGISSCTAEF